MEKKYKANIIFTLLTFGLIIGQLMFVDHVVFGHEPLPEESTNAVKSGNDAQEILNEWDYTETQEGILLKKYIGTATDIVIPGNIDGKQVFLQNTGTGTGLDHFPKNTTSIVVGNGDQKVKVTDGNAAALFSNLTNLTDLDARGLDTSDVTSMYRMFFNCESLVGLDVTGWDTSKVTNMNFMFQSCSSLKKLDIDSWNTGNVTTMYSMFRGCNSLSSLAVGNWDTSQVTDMCCMFYSCVSLSELDLSGWDTSKVTGSNMESMFYNCSNLTTLNVTGWDTSGVTSMQNMFFNCGSLTQLDLSSWDTGNVTSMNYMFHYCTNLKELNLNGWDTGKVKSVLYMFYNCSNLQILDLSGHDYSAVVSGWSAGMFDLINEQAALPTLIISNDPLIQKICDEPVVGRVPAGPTYHFEDGTFTDENGNLRSSIKYFDKLLTSDIHDFTISSIANKYIPQKEGAVFSGWYLDDEYTKFFESKGNILTLTDLINANLYAKYQNQYTVTFVDYDGSLIKKSLVLEGDPAIAPEENPVRKGYLFTGWDRNLENITEDTVITALYQKENEAQAMEKDHKAQENEDQEPPRTNISDNSVKKAGISPETEDTTNTVFYTFLLFLSLVSLVIIRRKTQ